MNNRSNNSKNKIYINDEIRTKMNKRLQILASFMHNNSFLRAEVHRISQLQNHFHQHIFLKPQLEAELKVTTQQMHQLELQTEQQLAALK